VTVAAPLAILSALGEEQQGLMGELTDAQCIPYAGREFWLGRLHGQPVVLALSRIGKVAAATTASALIERFGASRVVFTGVAGGGGNRLCAARYGCLAIVSALPGATDRPVGI